MRKHVTSLLIVLVVACLAVAAEEETKAGATTAAATAEGLVVAIYDEVSGTSGDTPDWERVRSNFDDNAVIVLRATREETRLMNVDAFIQDFVDFYDRIEPASQGFKETVVSIQALEFGNIAHCLVVYEAAILGSERPPQRGLDSWHLMKRDGRWWVVSVINESESVAGPIPAESFAG
jgi:hypothetical protein